MGTMAAAEAAAAANVSSLRQRSAASHIYFDFPETRKRKDGGFICLGGLTPGVHIVKSTIRFWAQIRRSLIYSMHGSMGGRPRWRAVGSSRKDTGLSRKHVSLSASSQLPRGIDTRPTTFFSPAVGRCISHGSVASRIASFYHVFCSWMNVPFNISTSIHSANLSLIDPSKWRW